MEEKFGLFIVAGDDLPETEEENTFDFIFDNAIDSYRADTTDELFVALVRGLNNDTISDTNWFFIMDLENGVLLSDCPSGFSNLN